MDKLGKCENAPNINTADIPVQTFRTCVCTYLQKELLACTDGWQLIAVGKDTFGAIAFLYPTPSVIGVPHPRAAGDFAVLFEKTKRELIDRHLRSNVRAQAEDSVAHRKAIWLKVHDSQPDVETSD